MNRLRLPLTYVGKDPDCHFYVELIVDEDSMPLGAYVKRVEHLGGTLNGEVMGEAEWLLSVPVVKVKRI